MTDVTDNFNRADGGLGANWISSPSFTGMAIASNVAGIASAAWAMAYWNPSTNTFSNDQYAEITIGSGTFMGPVVRHQSGVSSCYLLFHNGSAGGGPYLYKVTAGSFSLLSSPAATASVPGDVLRLSVTGSVLTILLNGASQATFTDSTYTSGQPGIAANTGNLDNFLAGPIAGGGGSPPPTRTLTGVGV